ncbi:MAG: nitronate monooxygenase [Vicinamibacterales bacterium]
MTKPAVPQPTIIQGGMGVAISNWRLARTVSRLGQLGVVSGTALDQVLARRLQDGDPGGHMRRGLDAFPDRAMAERVWDTYYIAGGRSPKQSYKEVPIQSIDNPRELVELCVVANFVEVHLAREGHHGLVGINYLEKIQIPHLHSIYGAMLAGVDYVLMGAGIPLRIPGVLDRLARHEPVTYPITVTGARPEDDVSVRFDPGELAIRAGKPLGRPAFLAIIASDVLAQTLHRRASGRVDGFIVEGPTAGGHNAPPRGKLQLTPEGEPLYGERDRVDLDRLRALGLPFWLAGGYGTPERVGEALAAGAAGVQVGTAFALCAESGMRADYRRAVLQQVIEGTARVYTDPSASPTGFPFKVVQLAGTVSDPVTYDARPRICDLGFLREAYRQEDGSVGYRCAAEPVNVYESKGGDTAATVGRKCICNALIATAGHPQVRAGRHVEPGIVTAGDDLAGVARFLRPGATDYTAADVIDTLLGSALCTA